MLTLLAIYATAIQAPARLLGSRRGATIPNASLDISTALFNAGQQVDSLVLDQLQGEEVGRASDIEAGQTRGIMHACWHAGLSVIGQPPS